MPCQFQSNSYRRLLRHTWDKHALFPNFKYRCNISDCPRMYTNHQSFRRNVSSHHKWFYELHLKGKDINDGNDDEVADGCFDQYDQPTDYY